jgi:exoribonuclease R
MAEIVDNMNLRHYNAQHAGRSSSQLYTLIFFRDKETLADARIVRVQANGLIVFVPKFGIEGPVYFGTRDDDAIGAKLSKAGTVRSTYSHKQSRHDSARAQTYAIPPLHSCLSGLWRCKSSLCKTCRSSSWPMAALSGCLTSAL